MGNQATPGPWIQLTAKKGHSHISNTTGSDWAAPDHYVGEVTEQNAAIVKAAPLMRAALLEVYRITGFCFNPTGRDIAVGSIAEKVIKALGETPTVEPVEGDQAFDDLIKHYGAGHD